MFLNNIVNISEILNLLKTCIQITYPISIFAYFAAIFTMGKGENIRFFSHD